MRYPSFLSPNGTIGFIAPSFGCTTSPYAERFDNAVKKLKQEGFNTILGPNCHASDGIGKSTTPEKCGAEINEFFSRPDIDIILSCGGGETMCEDLNFVDFDNLSAADPKWYMGYSDNTNLTFTLATLCDTASIYGTNSPSFGTDTWHKCLEDSLNLLKGNKLQFTNYEGWESESLVTKENPLLPYNITNNYSQKLYLPKINNLNTSSATNVSLAASGQTAPDKELSFSGRLLGGCLDCLVTLCGTKYDKVSEFNKKYAADGIIWFLECCDLNPFGVKRALWQLKNAGWFENVKGFLIGRSLHYQDDFGNFTCLDAYISSLSDLNVPIVADIDLGHLPPQMPIICGALGEVTATSNTLTLSHILR